MPQVANTVLNPSTGRATAVVDASTTVLVIPIFPGSGRRTIELNDEYGYANFAYYKLDVKQPPGLGVVVSPVVDDGSVGCQADPEFAIAVSDRNWLEEDNADNAEGKAFRSYVIEFDSPPKPGLGFTIELTRWVKYYYSIRNPAGTPGSGKFDRGRALTIHVVSQTEESFLAYTQRRQWA